MEGLGKMAYRITIEATDEARGGGSMPSYSILNAPTWALKAATEDIRIELADRARIALIVGEQMREQTR